MHFSYIILHIQVVSPVSGHNLVFFLNASGQPITGAFRFWHNKKAARLLDEINSSGIKIWYPMRRHTQPWF